MGPDPVSLQSKLLWPIVAVDQVLWASAAGLETTRYLEIVCIRYKSKYVGNRGR